MKALDTLRRAFPRRTPFSPAIMPGRLQRLVGRWATYLVPLAVLLIAASLRADKPAWIEQAQLRVFRTYQALHPRAYETVPVSIVDLDNAAPAQLGPWPWPRIHIARLLQRLTDLGVAAIVFDVPLREVDRTSPAYLLPFWLSNAELGSLHLKASQLPNHDRVLSEALAKAPVVLGFALTEDFKPGKPVPKGGLVFLGGDPTSHLPVMKGAELDLGEFMDAASGEGGATLPGDAEGMIDRIPLLFRLREVLYPSLVTEAVRVAQRRRSCTVNSITVPDPRGAPPRVWVRSIDIGTFGMPTDAQGRLWLYDTGHVPRRFIPAWRILTNDLERGALAGHVVFLGTTRPLISGGRASPLIPDVSAAELHAQAVEQIFLSKFLERPEWADRAELWCLLLIGLSLIWLVPHATASQSALLGSAVLLLVFTFAWYAFLFQRWLLDPLFPAAASAAVYASSALVYFQRIHSESRRVRQAFSRYISPALLDRLLKHPEALKLGGEMKNMTILFADIHNFTKIAEEFNAEDLTDFVNRFFGPMSKLILDRGGTIDKYMGDCIMAFWNAPLHDPHHARHACEAALDMRRGLFMWNHEQLAEARARGKTFIPVQIGIGINTGDCFVGNLGSAERFDFSVVGDAVNLASRIEGQLGLYGVDLVIGQGTYEQASDFSALELDLIAVKGKFKAAQIYALLGGPDLKKTVDFQVLAARHQEMLDAYRARRWAEARVLIGQCAKLATQPLGLGPLYDLYAERVLTYSLAPPPPDWNGIFEASA